MKVKVLSNLPLTTNIMKAPTHKKIYTTKDLNLIVGVIVWLLNS
jgi:hypothetical protein